jgi:hypothetical protein
MQQILALSFLGYGRSGVAICRCVTKETACTSLIFRLPRLLMYLDTTNVSPGNLLISNCIYLAAPVCQAGKHNPACGGLPTLHRVPSD